MRMCNFEFDNAIDNKQYERECSQKYYEKYKQYCISNDNRQLSKEFRQKKERKKLEKIIHSCLSIEQGVWTARNKDSGKYSILVSPMEQGVWTIRKSSE